MFNSFGNILRLTSFGESHGKGIGALLADGLGDTIRVSLSEAPEAEIPVARKLTDYIVQRRNHPYIPGAVAPEFQYLSPERRATTAVRNIGGENLPVVVAARLDGNMDFNPQFMPDYVYVGRQLPEYAMSTLEAFPPLLYGYVYGVTARFPGTGQQIQHPGQRVDSPRFVNVL